MSRLHVLLQLDIHPGRDVEFEQLWREHAEYLRTLPDNHGQSLLRRTDRPGGYVVLSDGTDEATFRAFERSEQQQEYLKKLWPLRRGGAMALLETALLETARALPAVSVANV